DGLWSLRINGHRADRLHGLLVEHRLVGRAAVLRFPDPAARRADVNRQALPFPHRIDRGDASAHRRRPDVARAEAGDGVGVDFDRRLRERCARCEQKNRDDTRCSFHSSLLGYFFGVAAGGWLAAFGSANRASAMATFTSTFSIETFDLN